MAPLLTPGEAAEFLGVSPYTLAYWRGRREGPPFVKVSPQVVRYRADDLTAYIEAHLVEPAA